MRCTVTPAGEAYGNRSDGQLDKSTSPNSSNTAQRSFPQLDVRLALNMHQNCSSYRNLVTGEIIREGDEYWTGKEWKPVFASVGCGWFSFRFKPMRRKIACHPADVF